MVFGGLACASEELDGEHIMQTPRVTCVQQRVAERVLLLLVVYPSLAGKQNESTGVVRPRQAADRFR